VAFDELLNELRARTANALAMGGRDKLEKRKAEGILNARERIDYLIDPGSFFESGMHAAGIRPEVRHKTPADAKVAGFARIDGREVGLISNDFTVLGASSSVINMKKIKHVKQVAARRGLPLIFLGESSGARMPDRMGASGRSIVAQDPTEYQRLRETPWVSALLGACYGSSTWYSAMSDFVVMRKGAIMAIASPGVTSIAINKPIEAEDLGGWKLLTGISGLADMAVDSDEEALEAIKRFLSYLPSHANEPPPVQSVPPGSDEACRKLLDILPESRAKVYDVRKIIAAIADKDSSFELKNRYGRSIATVLARLDGKSVGLSRATRCSKAARSTPTRARRSSASWCCATPSTCRSCSWSTCPVSDRRRRRAARNAGQGHELDERLVAGDGAEDHRDHAQELRSGLYQHGRRQQRRRGRMLADRRPGVHGPGGQRQRAARPQERGRPGALPAVDGRGLARHVAWALAELYQAQTVIDPRDTRAYLIRMLEVHRLRLGGGVGEHRLRNWPTSY
jgi:acetyl-CoA carboxylase beta subunit